MDFTECTVQILDKLDLFWDEFAYNKQIKITYGDLIFALISNRSALEASKTLSLSQRTLDRILPEALPSLSREPAPWGYKLLKIINIYYCSNCGTYKYASDFYKGYFKKCKECSKSYSREYRRAHLQKCREYSKIHYINNKHYYISKSQRRKKTITQQTPKWADIPAIDQIYNHCPEGYHVDHIIPLKGKLVSGLHVENNMQYLVAKDNLVKGNKVELAESA